MRKRFSAILLMLCFVIPLTTTYIFLQYQKHEVKLRITEKIKGGIDKEALALLKFNIADAKTQIQWINQREFQYKNIIYDLVEMKTEGDSIYYWCMPDLEETEINKKIEALVNFSLDQDNQRRESQHQVIHFYHSLYFEPFTTWQHFSNQVAIKRKISTINIQKISYSPPIPPPKIV